MKKASFLIVLFALFFSTYSYAQLGDMLNKAKDKAKGKASGSSSFVPDSKLIQPDAAISNVERNLKSINDSYYAEYKSKGVSYLNSNGQLWFARKVMEVARYYYSGGKKGYHGGGLVCDLGPAQSDPRYVALSPKMDEAEKKVKEMEAAKGFEFVECKDNNIIFKEVKTGKILSADESSRI